MSLGLDEQMEKQGSSEPKMEGETPGNGAHMTEGGFLSAGFCVLGRLASGIS